MTYHSAYYDKLAREHIEHYKRERELNSIVMFRRAIELKLIIPLEIHTMIAKK